MATTKISQLAALTTTDGAEELLINDGGTSKKVTIDNVLHDNSIRAEHYVDGSIATAHIADNAITSAKLGVDVIVAEDIANNAITVAELADNAVTTAKLNADAVTGAKIADDAIDSEHYTDGSIDTAHIGDDQVTAAKLANSINTDIATGVTANTTANAALPKSGGAMTGAITTNSTFDGRDVATDGTKLDGIAASANNYTHPNHSGEVTSTADGATVIADNVVDEANLKVSNTPTNGYFLSAQSGNTGGMTWAEVDALPSQSGNSGKYLTTNGSAASWAVLDTDANTTTKGFYEHAHTISSNYSITSGNNAIAASPITINSGVSVTIPSGSTWVIA